MRSPIIGLVAVLTAVACGSDHAAPARTADGGGEGGASTGAGGGPGTGGNGNSGGQAGADPGACPSLSISTAPIDCAQDFSHAKLMFESTCRPSLGGFQARCGAYDAVGVVGPRGTTWCFFSTGTGNLSGSFVDEGAGDCKSFDLDFQKPDVSACRPASGGDCGPDAG